MNEQKAPHEKLTDKNNGLTKTQEVLYAKDFKRADEAVDKEQSTEKQHKDS